MLKDIRNIKRMVQNTKNIKRMLQDTTKTGHYNIPKYKKDATQYQINNKNAIYKIPKP